MLMMGRIKLLIPDYPLRHPIIHRQDKRSLKLDLKEMELAHEDVVRQLKLDNAKEITKLRQEFELNARELQNKYEKKV